MKNIIKTVLAMLLLGLLMTTTVMGADPVYKITITNNSGHVTMKGNTYNAYKVFDVTYNEDKTAYSYTTADAFKDFRYTDVDTEYPNADKTMADYVGSLTDNSDKLNQFAAAVCKFIEEKALAASGTVTAESDDKAEIDVTGAGPGYYIVLATAITVDETYNEEVTALCALSTTDPTASINLKADVPTLDKTVKENSTGEYGKFADASIGDTVSFRLNCTIPSYADQYISDYKYTVNDLISSGGKLVENSVKIYIKTTSAEGSPEEEVDAGNYTVSTDGEVSLAGEILYTIDFKSAFIKDHAGKTMHIDYDVMMEQYLTARNDIYFNDNIAKIKYSGNPYDESVLLFTPISTARVYTYEFDIQKYYGVLPILNGLDAEELKSDKLQSQDLGFGVLEGAQFMLYPSEECKQGEEIKMMLVSEANESSVCRQYRLALQEEVDGNQSVDFVESNENGWIRIHGLDSGTYYLKETKAPEGYNQLEKPVRVELVAKLNDEGTDVIGCERKQEGTLSDHVNIQNQSGITLPTTGGIGTTVFYLIGGVLVLAAVILFITKKRMEKKEDIEGHL